MANIKLNDLPAADELSPEQEELIQGAGLKSFKPSVESLEAHEVYAAHLGAALAPEPLAPAKVAALDPTPVVQNVLVNAIDVTAPAASSAVTGPMAHAAPNPEIDVALWASPSVTSPDAPASTIPAAGRPVVKGETRPDGRWFVTTTGAEGFIKRYELFDKQGGKLLACDTVFADRTVEGELQPNGQWVEKTTETSAFKERIEVFRRPNGGLESRTTTYADRKVVGRWENNQWLETTTGEKDFVTRTDTFVGGPNGFVFRREGTTKDGGTLVGQRQGDQWVETITGSEAFKEQTAVYSKPVQGYDLPDTERVRVSRQRTNNDGTTTSGSWVGEVWVEAKNNPKGGVTRLGADGNVVVDFADGSYELYRAGDGWERFGYAREEGGQWIEDTLLADGTRIRNVWTKKFHEGAGSYDHVSQLVISGDKATLTRYHAVANYYWHWQILEDPDATLTWVYSVNADGNPDYGDLLEYHLKTFDDTRPRENNWMKAWSWDGGWDVDTATGGNPDHPTFAKPPAPSKFTTSESRQDFVKKTLAADTWTQSGWKDGKWVETVWNEDRTRAISYEYRGQDKKQLLAQSFAQKDATNGHWTVTTTRPGDPAKQTEVYETYGGRRLPG